VLLELGMKIFIVTIKIYSFFKYLSSTGNDEMCNFYMMYWVDGDQLLHDDVCTSPGPPQYYFRHDSVCSFFI
jgi:uncharacterized membrane protein (DUF106 family)